MGLFKAIGTHLFCNPSLAPLYVDSCYNAKPAPAATAAYIHAIVSWLSGSKAQEDENEPIEFWLLAIFYMSDPFLPVRQMAILLFQLLTHTDLRAPPVSGSSASAAFIRQRPFAGNRTFSIDSSSHPIMLTSALQETYEGYSYELSSQLARNELATGESSVIC